MNQQNTAILKALIDMESRGELDSACFSDIPLEVYHHPDCPAYSSTTLKTILKRSFNHLNTPFADSDEFAFGSAFHCYNNEPEQFLELYEICHLDSKRPKAYRDQVFKAKQQGKQVIMIDDFECIKVMSKKLWTHPEAKELLTGASFEQTYFSRCKVTGVLRKCRVDAIKGLAPSDLKSCADASEYEFAKAARRFQYRLSAAYYTDILSDYYGQFIGDFWLIACEKSNPYEISVMGVDEQSMSQGREEVQIALKKIEAHLRDPLAWKGYALGFKKINI